MSEVRLNIDEKQLKFLIHHIDWTLVPTNKAALVTRFLSNLAKREQSYGLAVAAVRELMTVAVTQYELLESHFDQIQEHEILHRSQPPPAKPLA